MINKDELFNIPVLEKLPSQGGKIEYLSVEQYKKKFNCKYYEGLIIPENLKPIMENYIAPLQSNYDINELTPKVLEIIQNPRRDLGIVNIGQPVGYAVIALNDIKQGEVLCIYSGRLIESKNSSPDDYYVADYKNSSFSVTALNEGGIARFLPHLPVNHQRSYSRDFDASINIDNVAKMMSKERPELSAATWKQKIHESGMKNSEIEDILKSGFREAAKDDTEFENFEFIPEHIKNQVATSNADRVYIKVNNITYLLYVAAYDIKCFEIVGFSYQARYWSAISRFPKLLLQDGRTLDQKYYRRKKIVLNILLKTGLKMITLNQEDCLSQIEDNSPLTIHLPSGDCELFSAYQFRERVVDAAVISPRYKCVDNNSFSLALAEKFKTKFDSSENKNLGEKITDIVESSDAEVLTYFRKPEGNAKELDNYTVDTVVKAKNEISYNNLLVFFKPIERRVIKFKETNEIIIKATNINDADNKEQPTDNLNIFLRKFC